jgi:hypothetical protein
VDTGEASTLTVVTQVTFLFFQYLIAAILIERTMEILVAIYNYLEMRNGWYSFWTKKAEAYQSRLDRLFGYNEIKPTQQDHSLSWLLWKIIVPTPAGVKDVISADIVRSNSIRFATRALAFILSVIFVYTAHLDPRIILQNIIKNIDGIQFLSNVVQWMHLRMILLAAVISMGTDPLHQVIGSIERYAQEGTSAKKGEAS